MQKNRIHKDASRHIETELYAYPYRKQEMEQLRDEILHPTRTDENIGGGRSNIPGDPTAKMGIQLVSHSKLMHIERVVQAIEQTYNQLPEVKQELIHIKYWDTSHQLTTIGICEKVGISESTYRRWRRQFITDVATLLGWN